jgi:quinol-cytochrome oxidoreductase complex cytochrome b subunit
MATLVTIDGHVYKKRSPFGAWLLIFPTLGIYFLVWFYKINKELRSFLKDDSIKPGLLTLSQIVPIWNYYTVYQTGERIGRAEQSVGLPVTVQPILGLVAGIVAGLHILYYQSELNKIWDAAAAGRPSQPSSVAGVPPVPPPPPVG